MKVSVMSSTRSIDPVNVSKATQSKILQKIIQGGIHFLSVSFEKYLARCEGIHS